MSDHWSKRVGETILDAPYYDKLRWRKAPEPVLRGEVISLLHETGLRAHGSRIEPLLALLPVVSKNADLFYVSSAEDKQSYYSAYLGRLLAMRVNGLSDQNKVANAHLKTWLQADQKSFCDFYLPRLLAFNTRAPQPVRLPLDRLIFVLSSWENNKNDIITSMTAEYFQSQPRKEQAK